MAMVGVRIQPRAPGSTWTASHPVAIRGDPERPTNRLALAAATALAAAPCNETRVLPYWSDDVGDRPDLDEGAASDGGACDDMAGGD